MPAERAPMRKVREVLRLRHALAVSERQIAITVGVSRSTVGEYLRRARRDRHHLAGAGGHGRRRAGAAAVHAADVRREAEPAAARLELRPQGAEAARRDAAVAVGGIPGRARRRLRLQPVLRSLSGLAGHHLGDHAPDAWAGEKLFVDFAGDTVPVFDAATGMERRAHIFVAVLGASNYTYAEARWSEGLADWIGAHVNALTAIGGVPEGDRLRQPQGRRHGDLPLRARHQPHLPGAGRALRHRDPADASAQAARQGKGRSGGADRPAVRAGAIAQPALLLAP